MLFTYPSDATEDNWLHECLSTMVEAALRAVRNGEPVADWPDCVPAIRHDELAGRTGLRNRYREFANTALELSNEDIEIALCALQTQNNIPAIFDGVSECGDLANLPEAFHEKSLDLYRFAFKLLSPLKLRDTHYRMIYNHIPSKVCPFCGCEYFEAPELPRHDLDHYIAISLYPFAGANLKNLVPMGDRCNSSYKKTANLLRCDDGNRRAVFDPYGEDAGAIDLMGSELFSEEGISSPTWLINLGEHPAAATWDDVWEIRQRIEKNVLNVEYQRWLGEFGSWCANRDGELDTEASVSEALTSFREFLCLQKFSDRAFLKIAFIELLQSFLDADELKARAIAFLADIARNSRAVQRA